VNAANAKNFQKLGVVILGAGASSRMGRPKLLLPWRDTTVIGAILRQWRELGAAQIAVVHRPDDAPLAAELARLDFPAHDRIENPQPERGMFSSIVCAANWPGWRKEISSWAIALGDQPHLRPDTLRQLLEFHSAHTGAICQPEFDGHTRHPVVLPRAAFRQLKNTRATTLKDFLKHISLPRVQCPVADAGLSLDMDTPEDYKQLQVSN
jgi:molybdenum cofactor cytidylyltransferase